MKTLLRTLAWTLSVIVIFLPALPAGAEAEEPYSFGVVPQFEQRKLFAIWDPIVKEISRRTGLAFKLDTTLQIQDFERSFVEGKFDFVYMNPYHILKAYENQNYLPLVRDKVLLRGIIVVAKDSPITEPRQLEGKTVAFPSPNAIGACMLTRADLENLYNVKVNPLYVKTHSSVYLHAAKGLSDAGGGVEKTLQEQDPAVKDALRVIYTTRELPPHPVAAHPRVPAEVRERVRQAFLEMGQTPEGRELLSKVPIKIIAPAAIEDYLVMKPWGVDRFWDPFWKD